MASLTNPKYVDKVHLEAFPSVLSTHQTLCAIKTLNVLMTKDIEKITCGNCKRKLYQMHKRDEAEGEEK